MSELTPCEFEILSAVAVGYSDKEIAQHIKIGASTVEHYLDRITKLELSTREELVLFAENNLVPLKTMPKD
jgi:DNA-binding NarL/FixJ family response regulator